MSDDEEYYEWEEEYLYEDLVPDFVVSEFYRREMDREKNIQSKEESE